MIVKTEEERFIKDLMFVNRAKDKSGLKPQFECLEIKESEKLGEKIIWATDSRRAHAVFLKNTPWEETENGVYSVLKMTKKEVILESCMETMPDLEKVIPDQKGPHKISVKETSFPSRLLCEANKFFENQYFNIDFILDLFPKKGDRDSYTIEAYGERRPMLFRNCTKIALIMPLEAR